MRPKKLLTGLFIGLSVLTLTACNSLTVREQAAPIQQNLLRKFDTLPPHTGTTGADVLRTMILWASDYNECAATHNALVDVLLHAGQPEP